MCPHRLLHSMFLLCSKRLTKLGRSKEGQMNCTYCGDLMGPETVIRVRRTLFGLRHSRYQGAYCAGCKISIVVGETDTPSALRARAGLSVSPGWWRSLLGSSKLGSMARDER